jgi:hypothetical protein
MTTTITVTRRVHNPDQTTRALCYLYDVFATWDGGHGDMSLSLPVRFAKYLLDHPEEWKAAQEMAEQLERDKPKEL